MAEGCRITCSGSTKRRRRPWSSTSALHLSVSVLFAAQNAQAFFASWGLTSSSSLVSVASGGVHRAGHGSASGWKMPLRTERWSETRGHRELLSRWSSSRRCTAAHLTRKQMIDLGLLPPEESEMQADRSPDHRSVDADDVEGGADGEEELEGAEEPDAIGLIGHFEARQLLAQKGKEGEFVGSLDMSMTTRDLVSTEEGVALPSVDGAEPCLVVSWDELAVVLKKAKKGQYGCWELYGDGCASPSKVSDISESTNRPAMLCAPLRAPGPPTMVLGGFAMHRISGGDQKSTMEPGLDTEHKVSASGARWTNGRVLDTCTGLGYTAIAAARCTGVTGVVTVELDEVSLRMCERNPWSRRMFEDSKITSLQGDCCEIVKGFRDGEFAAIIHDPPARALCKTTDMYGAAFYKDLARVLKPGGTLFHYIGNPESSEGGRLFRGVIDRLIGAGFHECKSDKKAFGVVARR